MKTIVIKLKVKPVWERPRGHQAARSGAGSHDSRPKRLRTRQANVQCAIREWS